MNNVLKINNVLVAGLGIVSSAGIERRNQPLNNRICRCCGEALSPMDNAFSRNPNVCSSCSSMADGVGDTTLFESDDPVQDRLPRFERARDPAPRNWVPVIGIDSGMCALS
jgi:hypothetical protein